MKFLLMVIGTFFTFALASAQTGEDNEGVSYKLDERLVQKVMETSTSDADKANRQVMVNFIERLCTSYMTKDIGFIQKVYGEDTLSFKENLILVNKEEKQQESSNGQRVSYMFQNKKQYCSMLAMVFSRNISLNVVLDDVVVEVSSKKSSVYGLRLKHGWTTEKYDDKGYLFLLWDFTNPDAPQIHVRTWQPTEIKTGVPIDEDEIFTIDDFDV